MPFATFTVRAASATPTSPVYFGGNIEPGGAGYHRADRFHRFSRSTGRTFL